MTRAPRRTTELALLLMAGVVVGVAYVLASLGRLAELPADIVPFLFVVLGLFLGAHVALRILAPAADAVLLPLAGLLNGFGYVVIARLDEDRAGYQSLWTAVGVAAFIGTLLVVRETRMLERYRYTLMLVGIGLLLLPLVPGFGRTINGARIWVSAGPINFQPGEFAKIALAVFFAAYLVDKRELLALSSRRLFGLHLPELRHLGPILAAWGASLIVMVAEKDLGSSLLFFALFVVMLWVATERSFYLVGSLGMFSLGAYWSWTRFGHVKTRVDTWLDPFADPFDSGFQVTQAAFALAEGGLTGTGLGVGRPTNIPEVETDFIFAAIGEELGLVGVTAVLFAYLLMIGTGLRIALVATRPFEKLLATGLTALTGVQAFIIIGGVIRLLPLTGVTLPFVSYGGSSLVANYVLLALLLRISHESGEAEATARQAAHKAAPPGRGMNRQIQYLGVALCLCFVALFVQLNRIQVFDRDSLRDHPANFRAVVRDFSGPRGTIATADGVLVATSIEVDDDLERERTYPEGDLYAHVTGFFSFEFGADGVERVYNDELAGQTTEQQFSSLENLLSDTDTTGNVTLTLRHDVQQAARASLGNRKGSVVALDPRNGDLLALWSFPSYDPTPLGSTDLDLANATWNAFEAQPLADDPRLPRTYREIYFPGSTFKVVTAAAGIADGVLTTTQPDFPVTNEYIAPKTTVPLGNFGGNSCGGTLITILAQSCNTAFAELGAEYLGPGPMIATAEAFGFNAVPPLDLTTVAASQFPDDFGAFLERSVHGAEIVENTPAIAQAAIGQNDVKATPLQMAMVAAAVANDGVMMSPHVMAEIRAQNGDLIERYDPNAWRTPLLPSQARILRQGMETVVTSGTAQNLAIGGFTVGAEAGTAQVDAARPNDTHAWVIAFAGPPGEAPTVAVAVIVESVAGAGQQTGGGVAAPIALQVLQAALAPATPAG